MNPKKAKITEAIKMLGYNSRQVSVREGGGSLETSFDVIVRDSKVNMKAVEEAVKNHESIDRCQFSGEILGGGNTFIFVKATREVEEIWANEFLPQVEIAAVKMNEENKNIQINENYTLSVGHNGYGYRINYYGPGERNGTSVGYENTTQLKQVAFCIAVHNQKMQYEATKIAA